MILVSNSTTTNRSAYEPIPEEDEEEGAAFWNPDNAENSSHHNDHNHSHNNHKTTATGTTRRPMILMATFCWTGATAVMVLAAFLVMMQRATSGTNGGSGGSATADGGSSNVPLLAQARQDHPTRHDSQSTTRMVWDSSRNRTTSASCADAVQSVEALIKNGISPSHDNNNGRGVVVSEITSVADNTWQVVLTLGNDQGATTEATNTNNNILHTMRLYTTYDDANLQWHAVLVGPHFDLFDAYHESLTFVPKGRDDDENDEDNKNDSNNNKNDGCRIFHNITAIFGNNNHSPVLEQWYGLGLAAFHGILPEHVTQK